MTDFPDDLAEVEITTVQLPASAARQRTFLKRLQAALGAEGSLSSLTPGPSPDVFVLPHAAEKTVRSKLGLGSDLQWTQTLQAWGALSVNHLSRAAYAALMSRGASVRDGALTSAPKISVSHAPAQALEGQGAFVPAAFAGPYDWHLDHRGVNAAEAWRLFAAEPRFAAALPWADVRVAHIDTGYTEHAALAWRQGSSPTVLPAQGRDFWDGNHDQDGPRDPFLDGNPGHGTRISATISGFYPQAPGGPFYGVAPGATIIPFRVTDSVLVDHVLDKLRDAIRAAIAADCQVVNISLGALWPSRSLASALDEAYEAGLIVVCAAGQVWGEVIYPGRFNRCVTMAGVGPGLKPWSSSAKGAYVDLCGPADEIRRVRPDLLPPGQTASAMADRTGDGTSYATACCAGAAALWLAWHGGAAALKARYAPSGLWQIPAAFKHLAMQTARPGQWPASEAGYYGKGVLDVAALLGQALPADGTVRKEAGAYEPRDDGVA